MAPPRERICAKVLVLGDSHVGKTSLLRQVLNRRVIYRYEATQGCEIVTKDVMVGDQTVSLKVFDTAGQSRFKAQSLSFYKEADCCVLVFDVTRSNTFRSLDAWRDEFLQETCAKVSSENVPPLIVIGNKADLENRSVSARLVLNWCRLNGNVAYFETSSREDSVSLQKAFRTVIISALVYKTGNDSSGSVFGRLLGEENQRLEIIGHVVRLKSKLWFLAAVMIFGLGSYIMAVMMDSFSDKPIGSKD